MRGRVNNRCRNDRVTSRQLIYNIQHHLLLERTYTTQNILIYLFIMKYLLCRYILSSHSYHMHSRSHRHDGWNSDVDSMDSWRKVYLKLPIPSCKRSTFICESMESTSLFQPSYLCVLEYMWYGCKLRMYLQSRYFIINW